MKRMGTAAATIAALMMAATPAIAAAPQSAASKLSVANGVKRAGAPVSATNRAMGGSTILIGLAVVAVVVGIILLTDDDDDEPASP